MWTHIPWCNEDGQASIIETKGNPDVAIILRGKEPNYYEKDVNQVVAAIKEYNLNPYIIIDCSHGNSQKMYWLQADVVNYIISKGLNVGLMIEVIFMRVVKILAMNYVMEYP